VGKRPVAKRKRDTVDRIVLVRCEECYTRAELIQRDGCHEMLLVVTAQSGLHHMRPFATNAPLNSRLKPTKFAKCFGLEMRLPF
jgi:hypothetical protein